MAMVARIMDFRALTNSLILCHFEDVVIPDLLTLIESVTGWQWAVDDLRTTAARIFELKRLLNARLGMTPADDALPERILKAYEEGPAAGYAPDLAAMLERYYEARQWDRATGVAKPERLAELGLAGLAERENARPKDTFSKALGLLRGSETAPSDDESEAMIAERRTKKYR